MASYLDGMRVLAPAGGRGAPVPALDPPIDDPTKVGRTGDILVVDDSEPVRALTAHVLSEAGYRVTQAPDALEALRQLQVAPVDLVLTDIVLPRMSGLELARQLAESHPRIRTLLMTGYANRQDADEIARTSHSGILAKPFTPAELVVAVHKAIRA